MTTTGTTKLVKVDAPSYNHSVGDKKKPTAYLVYAANDDSTPIGKIESRSEESWTRKRSGIRCAFRGYSRFWEARDATGKRIGYRHYSREQAIDTLTGKIW